MVYREENIFKGQALNIALQIMIKRYGVDEKEEDEFIKELFILGLKVFRAGKKVGFLEWTERD